jgi:sulfatase maturation enzyme AslB (radical SAM superfamily)
MAHLEITTKVGCRVACSYCPQDLLNKAYKGNPRESYNLSLEVFKECLEKVPLSVRIHFTGFSEPFLNPDCAKMVAHAASRGYMIEVSTTLIGMTPEDVKIMEHVEFKLFNVHLPSKDSSDENIPVDDLYMSTIRALDESKIHLEYHCNAAQVHPSLATGRNIRFVIPHDRAGNVVEEKKTILKIKRLTKTIKQFENINSSKLKANGSQTEGEVRSLLKVLNNDDVVEANPPKTLKRGKIRCVKDLRENVMLPNGDVVACCNDYGLEHSFGNLREQPYESLFHGDGYRKLEKMMSDDSHDLLCRRDCKHARGLSLKDQLLDNRYVYNLKHVRRPSDVVLLAKRAKREVKKKLFS